MSNHVDTDINASARRQIDLAMKEAWNACNNMQFILDRLGDTAEAIGDHKRNRELSTAGLSVNRLACDFHAAINRLREGGEA